MWFRNLLLYRCRGWKTSADKLDAVLQRLTFQDCGAMDMASRGWVAPRGDGGALVHASGKSLLIALGSEQKLLPPAVIRQYAQARAEEIEEAQGYAPGRKQMRDIREQVTAELLPRAFTRKRRTYVWIDLAGGWLAIDAAAAAAGDEVIESLRKCAGEVPLAPIKTRLSPAAAMTGWLAADEAPSGFSIDRDCELRAPTEDKATVRYVRHALDAEQLSGHLRAGKQATRLALTWSDRLSFVLQDNLQVKRLAFLDLLKEQAQSDAQNADELFDADFAIMSGELSRFVPDLVDALGGEAED